MVTEGGGPEWVASWPLLVLTLGTVIATPIAWEQANQAFQELVDACTVEAPCFPGQIDASSADAWEVATNVLLVSSIVLGLTTLIVFIAEGATPTETHQVERPVVSLDVGPGGLSLHGAF